MKRLKPTTIIQTYKLIIVLFGMFFIYQSQVLAMINNEEPIKTNEVKYIIVWDNNGGCISFPVEEMPRFEYNFKDSLVTCVTTIQSLDIPLKDVHKYTVDSNPGIPTTIRNTSVEGQIKNEGNSIYLSNFKVGSEVMVCRANGVVILHNKIDKEGNAVLDTSTWKRDVYVLIVNKVSYKIIKK